MNKLSQLVGISYQIEFIVKLTKRHNSIQLFERKTRASKDDIPIFNSGCPRNVSPLRECIDLDRPLNLNFTNCKILYETSNKRPVYFRKKKIAPMLRKITVLKAIFSRETVYPRAADHKESPNFNWIFHLVSKFCTVTLKIILSFKNRTFNFRLIFCKFRYRIDPDYSVQGLIQQRLLSKRNCTNGRGLETCKIMDT